MSTNLDAAESFEAGGQTRHIGFVGDSDVGKTTVATLVAARLAERTQVTVAGDVARFVSTQDTGNDGAMGIEWTVEDCTPGVDAFGPRPERLDTVFVVATPETLDSVAKYEQVARQHGVDCFLVVNRFRESAKDQLRASDGPEIAEYIYVDEEISAAISDSRVPTLPDWTVEAILIEALQPERQEAERALAALDSGERSIVNVEVGDRADADALIDSFKTAGYGAAYFECNCQCHDGHVLARRPQI